MFTFALPVILLALFGSIFTGKVGHTGVLYKQTTYNLLREDTEGYAKLISEYYLAAERGPPTAEQVNEAFEKVK